MSTILAVDDSASMKEMVKFTLSKAGYDVLEASDGLEALEIAKKTLVDAVIADVHMPNMDGITLIGELRALSGYKFVPILMLTTDSDVGLKQKAASAGATGWLVKPFSPDRLLATVKRVLD
jgi:two-component system chemotaxis response regulator CheY